jgi:hypothetical protein
MSAQTHLYMSVRRRFISLLPAMKRVFSMNWVQLIAIIAGFGFLFWGVQNYLKVGEPFKGLIMLVLVLIGVGFFMHAFGVNFPGCNSNGPVLHSR